jgi:hypothetical protein
MTSWNTGAVQPDGNAVQASQAITIPAGVKAGDVILFVVTGWAWGSAATDVIQASSTGTTPVAIGTTLSTLLGGAGNYVQSAIFRVAASAADPGKIITVSYVSGNTAKWTIALGAWSAVSQSGPVDVSGAVTAAGHSVSITCPAETSAAGGDWAIQLVSCSLEGSAYTGGTGFTQRESNVSASGGGAFIYDSNGSVGPAGSNVGGAVFSNAGNNSQWAGFTVGLAPAAGGDASIVPVYAAAIGVL